MSKALFLDYFIKSCFLKIFDLIQSKKILWNVLVLTLYCVVRRIILIQQCKMTYSAFITREIIHTFIRVNIKKNPILVIVKIHVKRNINYSSFIVPYFFKNCINLAAF
ncbi:hypothetical protein EDEG_02061 [Edhazardia aedis USNM 41457]|uniref:Uncharacterized protein n=1 Tax=Edhazardia aedis (strain USNM 41457) TaxID=1003232 RepID=J9DM16_EDHAE|nr:hypothetical protein EDEG_02061 [Edhazardia aedis USNM 41457]|eukprot:EJW03630.1 hypothetical protein EDEG_02061 [Edhazardia aedis USNM 41457]